MAHIITPKVLDKDNTDSMYKANIWIKLIQTEIIICKND